MKIVKRILALLLVLLMATTLISYRNQSAVPGKANPEEGPAEEVAASAEEIAASTETTGGEEPESLATEPEIGEETPADETAAELSAEEAAAEEDTDAAPPEDTVEAAAPAYAPEYLYPESILDLSPADRAAAMGLPAPPELDPTSWELVLANSYNSIFERRPQYGSFDGTEFDLRAADAAASFLSAARDHGNVIPRRGYIGYEVQQETFYFPKVWGTSAWAAAQEEFGPGTSDHQTALGFDAVEGTWAGYDLNSYFPDSEVGKWMVEHCAEYGFILRYPQGKEAWYGTACNHSGHFRYVGVEAATYIMDNGLCLEELLYILDPSRLFVPNMPRY